MSHLGKLRRFEKVETTEGKITLVRREVKIPAVALVDIGPCLVCQKPLFVAIGQRIRFHGGCRKMGRKMFGRATRVREVTPKPKKV